MDPRLPVVPVGYERSHILYDHIKAYIVTRNMIPKKEIECLEKNAEYSRFEGIKSSRTKHYILYIYDNYAGHYRHYYEWFKIKENQ